VVDDQHVERPAERVRGGGDAALGRRRIAEVLSHHRHALEARVLVREAVDADARAALLQAARDGPTDAARAPDAGD
jgi:hypothetical protein